MRTTCKQTLDEADIARVTRLYQRDLSQTEICALTNFSWRSVKAIFDKLERETKRRTKKRYESRLR